jgi:predicted ATP-dependent endonuclease of OLD family
MTKNKIYPNILLVEGDQDKRVIPEFIEQNGIKWENNREPIVYIKSQGSKEALLDIDEIDTALQESGLKALGIVVDADERPENTKQRLNQICEYFQINLADNLTKEG